MKQLIKNLTPPILLDLYRKYNFNKYGWQGNYQTWKEAENTSTGYDSDEIIQKVRASLLKVKNGEAIYERDSVIFDGAILLATFSWTYVCQCKIGGCSKCLILEEVLVVHTIKTKSFR